MCREIDGTGDDDPPRPSDAKQTLNTWEALAVLKRWLENPWSIVFGSALALVVSSGPVGFFTFGVFLKPISQEFGWNRGEISAASGVSNLMVAITVPLIGILIDRWGVRRVLLPSIVLFAISFAALSLAPASLPVFAALYAIVGVCSACQGPPPYVKVIAAWFDRQRGLALGIAMAGAGIGVVIVPQLARILIEAFGWRIAYVGVAAVLLVVAIPSVSLFLREPEEAPTRRGTPPSEAPGLSVREALTGCSRFWRLSGAVFLVGMAVNGTIVHLVPLLTDRGLSPAVATSILSAVGIATIAGRVFTGYLADRFFAPFVAAGFFLLPCFGMYLLASGLEGIVPVISVVSLGLALGCEVDMIGYLTSRYVGLKRFGELYGYLFAIFLTGTALGPYLMGVSFDIFKTYDPALLGFGLALVIASVLVATLGTYLYPFEPAEIDFGGVQARDAATESSAL
jgi:MFS family permease